MKHVWLILLLVSGGMFGWLAPDLAREPAAPVPAAGAQPVAPTTGPAAAVARSWNDEVVLPRAADGHFYAEVVIEGASAMMLVDTGASMVALTAADADAIGVAWRSERSEPVARGAGGIVYGVSVVLDRVELGGLEARDVEAVVVPEGLAISLLGQSFLSQVARVEIDRQKMVLGG